MQLVLGQLTFCCRIVVGFVLSSLLAETSFIWPNMPEQPCYTRTGSPYASSALHSSPAATQSQTWAEHTASVRTYRLKLLQRLAESIICSNDQVNLDGRSSARSTTLQLLRTAIKCCQADMPFAATQQCSNVWQAIWGTYTSTDSNHQVLVEMILQQ